MIERLIWIVLDGVGAGALPDARDYGDEGADTLGNLALSQGGLRLAHLEGLGLGKLHRVKGLSPQAKAVGAYGRLNEASPGKDSATGHWELAGVINTTVFPTYPRGFPPEVLDEFERRTGKKVLGNVTASGTEIIKQLGDRHVSTGLPILYTSADSVFQLTAHVEVIPPEELYRMARQAREMLQGEHNVSRVIARPFTGRSGGYVRVHEARRDFPLEPPRPTLLERLRQSGWPVAGAGKIADLYAGRSFQECEHTKDNAETMRRLSDLMVKYGKGLLMVNLVDFDTMYGHRNDPDGFCRALEEFDALVPSLREALRPADACFITSDHGCDPTHPGSDHTREYGIFMAFGKRIKGDIDVGDRASFADCGATAAELFGLDCKLDGESFAQDIVVKD
jgi:phosphopentomutase